MDDDLLPIGRRVAYWRGRRKISQQVFADRLGKSKSWVDKIERGVRRLDKLSVLQEMADVLGVDVRRLAGDLGELTGPAGPTHAEDVNDIREVLARHDESLGGASARPGQPLDTLRQTVTHAWMTYQAARYPHLLRSLPGILVDAQLARACHRGEAGEQAADLLGQVYRIIAAVLNKRGEWELAWLAADRGMAAAARVTDPVPAAVAVVPLGEALRGMGRHRAAMEVCVAVAHRLAPGDPLGGSPSHLSVHGALLLQAAQAAAGRGDEAGAAELVDQADAAAARVGNDGDHHWTAFGPIAVAAARIGVDVDLGLGADAAARYRDVAGRPAYRTLPAERRAEHLLDVARGCAHSADLISAGRALVAAAQISAAEADRPVARNLLAAVMRGSTKPESAVARLADELGVGV